MNLRRYFFCALVVFIFFCKQTYAQYEIAKTEQGAELYRNAKEYIRTSDYANAIMVFNQAVAVEPNNLIFRRELATAYYLQKDMLKAEKIISPLLKQKEADVETFQVASRVLRATKKTDEAKEAIEKGLVKFPNAGVLYEELGEIYTQDKKYQSAAKAWEKGIEKNPTFHINYYNLSKVYFFTKNYLWAIFYGETFVNIESFSSKSEEIKKIVFESYKFMMAELNNAALDGKENKYSNPTNFEEACLKIFDQLRPVVTGGIHTENLIQLRTRFLLEWNKQYAKYFPLELITNQHNLLSNAHYECYNYWLFGSADNDVIYKKWTQRYADRMNAFNTYFRENKLQPKINQYYKSN